MLPGNKQAYIKRSIRFQFTVGAFVLLVLALGFNALLSLNSLEKLYVESIASQYSAIGKDLQRKLEQALRLGKNITKFVGIDKMLEETKANILKEFSEGITVATVTGTLSAADLSVSVALPEGSILYSTDAKLVGTTLAKQVKINYGGQENDNSAAGQPGYVKYQNTYITLLPIRDKEKQWKATTVITFNEKQINALLNAVRDSNIKLILLILGSSLLLLIILLSVVTPNEANFQKLPKVKIVLVMLLVIGSAQIVFSGLNTNAFGKYYLQINKRKMKTLTTLLKKDIEFLFSKGIQIDKLVKMDAVMGDVIAASPDLSDIRILDAQHLPLYMATKTGVIDFQKATTDQFKQAYREMPLIDPAYNLFIELQQEKTVAGYLSSNLSKAVIFAKLFEIVLDSVTILVISMLFFGELLILILLYIESQATELAQRPPVHYGAIRPAAFLLLFGLDSSISFLPLHMETLYEPIWGLSKDLVMGLPISVEMFTAGFAAILAGFWLDRRGWHEPFLGGIFLAGMGLLYSWQAPNALHFIISRGVVGLGYGFALMASQGFVLAYTDERNKAQGLSTLFAGVYAGSICGGAAGAMLAERIGYSPVFFCGAVILFSIIGYIVFFMRNAIRKPGESVVKQSKQAVTMAQFFHFFFNRNIFSLLLFAIIPGATAVVGFINYFYPVYLNRLGTTQSDIGRIYMIFGLCLIYIAPFISKYVDISNNKKVYIIVGGIVGSVAFLVFYFFGGLVMTTVAVFLLGISMCFDASRPYALKFKVTQELGAGKSLGIFSSTEKLGQVIGPMVFGVLFLAKDINKAITFLGLIYLMITLIFMFFAKSDRNITDTETQAIGSRRSG